MSGIFGYDGYAYQSNVCLNMVLGKIAGGKNVQKFSMEVRKVSSEDERKDEYTVDLIIQFKPDEKQHYDAVEIKGGLEPDYEHAKSSLDQCAIDILSKDPETVISKQIVVRVGNDTTLLPPDIAILPLEDRFEGDDGYSELDSKNVNLIKKLIENEVLFTRRDYIAKSALHTLKHFLDYKLRELAWKLREETQEFQSCEISIEDFFRFESSLADLIQLESNAKYNKDEALKILLGRNEHGVFYTGGAAIYEGPGSPATDSGVI